MLIGPSNVEESGDRILQKISNGGVVEHLLCFSFRASNNKAKFEALIASLGLTWSFGATSLKISNY